VVVAVTGAPGAAGGQGIAAKLRTVQVGLRPDLEVCRHVVRGEPAYVVRDPVTFASHRLTLEDYLIIVNVDASRTLAETFERLVESKQLTAAQEEDYYQFILSLHALGFLSLPISNDKTLYERHLEKQAKKRKALLTAFFCFKVPLYNPDRLLNRTMHWFRPLFTRTALLIWLIAMALGAALVVSRWEDLSQPIAGLLAAGNLPVLWLTLIGLKVIHEFGHAYACKHFGGHVPQMGAMVVLLTPCAYVDASASWGFERARDRIIVALGGMYFESMMALAALVTWCFTGPSLVNSVAYQVMVLASITTIGFNINPLLKYDGYYVLSDLLGIPNLRPRATAECMGVLKRAVLGIQWATAETGAWLRVLLFSYGAGAGVYRVMLILGIATVLALRFGTPGLVLCAGYLAVSMGVLIGKLVGWLLQSKETVTVRGSARLAVLTALVALIVAGGALPAPPAVRADGTIGRETETTIRAGTAGEIAEILVHAGASIPPDGVLCRLANRDLEDAVRVQRATVDVARRRAHAALAEGTPTEEAAMRHAAGVEEARLASAEYATRALTARVSAGDVVLRCLPPSEQGRFIEPGTEIAVVGEGAVVVRALLDGQQIARVRPVVGQRVQCIPSTDPVHRLSGSIIAVSLRGSREITQAALTHPAGGGIAINPADGLAAESFYEVVVKLDDRSRHASIGETVEVRFDSPDRVSIGRMTARAVQRFINRVLAG